MYYPHHRSTHASEQAVKEPFDVTVRKGVLLFLAFACLYWFVWIPWRPSRASFLIFFGFGMIQLAATYVSEFNPGDIPPLFMSSFVSLFLMLLAIAGLVVELVLGFRAKPWWEALLLPLAPFAFASVMYRVRNPAPSFFTGVIALVMAVLLKLFT
jgi:hypothetical protein